MKPYIVSFYPRIPMEENLTVFQPLDGPRIRRLLTEAAGILLPPYTPPWRYHVITRLAKRWFPRLETRFEYRGKAKQISLFQQLGVRCPETCVFDAPAEAIDYVIRYGSPWGYPLVLKGDTGGGGSRVFPVSNRDDMFRHIAKLPPHEPVLLQRWIEHGGKDLRVVTYGSRAVSYFRVGDGSFYNNVCRGGRLDYDSCPEQRRTGQEAVLEFCRGAMIDIAGFDLMFPDNGRPVFIEINFHFGRKGLGGASGHQRHMLRAVLDWRAATLAALDRST
ncbi:MAG: ATP-grasp domain-containing protein [Desulforhabdus sp.]|jgi:ribosomal protein S6--L-glutamate ligase|nr:ATP-grasp domain-containing protein [Desulforhabdus sp.]